jgi:hypothetical protein
MSHKNTFGAIVKTLFLKKTLSLERILKMFFLYSEPPSYGGHFDTKNSKIEAIIFFDVIGFGINHYSP